MTMIWEKSNTLYVKMPAEMLEMPLFSVCVKCHIYAAFLSTNQVVPVV